jgi:mandelate racemase
VALWDATAIAAERPLVSMLGAAPCRVRAYNSSGLGLMAPEAAADEAEKLLERGFGGVKLRLGYSTLAEDLAVTRAVRTRIPDTIALLADYNQALSVEDAIRRGGALQDEGVYWLEEPTLHEDLAGNAAIARALDLPVQLGENLNGPLAVRDALAAGACDYVMPDLARIGGVTGWMQAAGLAAAANVEMSSHLFPEVSAHLLAATPTRHWLEWVDWMEPLLTEPLEILDGFAQIPDRPGNGLEWDPVAVEKFRMD